MQDLTENELLAALREAQEAQEDPEGAFSKRELMEIFDLSDEPTRDRIRMLVNAGRMECVKVRRVRMDGVQQTIPGYRLVEPRGAE